MRFVEILETFSLPPAKDVFPDQEVRAIHDNGFDVGAPYGTEVSGRDRHSVDRFFDDHKEEGRFDGKDSLAYLSHWLRGPRYDHIIRELLSNAKIENDKIRIERVIVVSKDEALAIANGKGGPLGTFWSYSFGEPHWHIRSGTSVRIIAEVDPSKVDWITTIRRNANYLYGDDEWEIALSPGTPLKLVLIAVDGEPLDIKVTSQVA